MLRRVRVVPLVVTALLALPATAQAARGCEEPTRGWRHVPPHELGLDARIVAQAVHSYQDRRGYAIRIYRHGCLVGQDTNGSSAARSQFETWGITRAVLSMLVGRAMALGLLAPEDPLGALVPEADAAHGAIRVRDMLTLTSGLRSDPVRDEELAVPDRRHDTLVSDVPHRPGTRFHEAPGASALLVAALERATGEDVQAFAQRELLGPIGIPRGRWRWMRDDAGHTHGAHGLNLMVDDVARLGELLRRGGSWEGRRLLPERWMREAFEPGAVNPCHGWSLWVNARQGCTRTEDGYRTTTNDRLLPGLPADVWQLRGRLDQMVTVFPALGIMVVRLGTRGGDSRSGDDGGRWERDVGLQLLGAVRDAELDLTRPRADLVVHRARPYDQPQRSRDTFDPYFPPPLPPPGPPRARAVWLEQAVERVGRRRRFAARVRCPQHAAMPCTGELSLEGARAPVAFSLAPGTSSLLSLRLARRPKAPTGATLRAVARDDVDATVTALRVLLRP